MTKASTLRISLLVFGLLSVFLFFFFGYHTVFFDGPQGIHFIRQSDTLSFISQYYNQGLNPFEPQLFNLSSIDGKTVSEFPVFYYLIALLYELVGIQPHFLKIFHLTVFLTGVYCIFRICLLKLNDVIYSALITLFLFTSAVINYYAFNYLPDISALGFVLIGWYFALKYSHTLRRKTLFYSLLFFTLAALIKVTYLISLIAILLFVAILLFKNKNQTTNEKKACKNALIAGSVGVFVVFIWNLIMINYTIRHESSAFIYYPLPIWELNSEEIGSVWLHMSDYWYTSYLAHSSHHLLFVLIFFQFIFLRKASAPLMGLMVIMLLGTATYFLLFYSQFKDHDYYVLNFVPLIVLFLLNGVDLLKKLFQNKYVHYFIQLIIAVVVVIGVNYSRIKLERRFDTSQDIQSATGLLIEQNKRKIDALKIDSSAKFIVAPDLSPNGGLFYLNRMGWTIQDTSEIRKKVLLDYIHLGAQYLFLATENPEKIAIGKDLGEIILQDKGFALFKLK